MQEGRGDDAEPYLRAAWERGLRTPRILGARARLHDLRGETERTVAAWQEAVNLAPRDPALLRGVALFYLGRGEEEAALVFFEHAARADPDNPVVARERAGLLEKRGARPAALDAVRGPVDQDSAGAGSRDRWPVTSSTRPSGWTRNE